MARRATAGLWLGLVVMAGCINREGRFEGELAQESHLERGGAAIAAGAPKTITVTTEQTAGKLVAQVDGCSLELDETGTAEIAVRSGQSCELAVGSYRGVFEVSGTGGVNRNSAILSLTLTGTPKESGVTGTLGLSFTGKRK